MRDITLIYFQNTLRVLGLLLFAVGIVLSAYQYGVLFHTGAVPAWSLDSLIHIPRWLRQGSPLIQGLCGWPLVFLDTVPLPVLLLVGGLLGIHV